LLRLLRLCTNRKARFNHGVALPILMQIIWVEGLDLGRFFLHLITRVLFQTEKRNKDSAVIKVRGYVIMSPCNEVQLQMTSAGRGRV